MAQQKTTAEKIAEIANGFGQGVNNYYQMQDRKRTQSIQDEAIRRQQALDSQNLANNQEDREMKRKEYGINAELKKAQIEEMSLPFEQTRDYQKAKALEGLKSQNRAPVMSYEEKLNMKMAKQEEADAKKIENKKNQKRSDSAIADFELANPDIIPTSKDAEEVKNLNASNKSFQEVGKRVAGGVGKLTKLDLTTMTNNWKMVQQDLTEMKLQAKNLADLGVLNGPDLTLVNETLGSLSPSNLAILGPEKAKQRLEMALKTANDKLVNAASARNYKPIGGKPKQAPVIDPAAIKATSREEKIKFLMEGKA
jgi:hypothetical protein